MSQQSFDRRGGKVSARFIIWPLVLLGAIAVGVLFGPMLLPEAKPKVVFVTADSTPFWDKVVAGAEQAAAQADVDLHVFRADGTLEGQGRVLSQAMEMCIRDRPRAA